MPKITRAGGREFASVVDWDDFQYVRTDKKPKPPWAWFRVQLDFLRSPLWTSLTKSQRADFIAMCAAASQTGNLVPIDDAKWLKFFDLSRKNVSTLLELSLISVSTLPADDPRIRELRSALSVRRPSVGLHKEAETDTETDTHTTSAERLAARERDDSKSAFEGHSTPSSDRVSQSKIVWHDERDFADLKDAVRQVVAKHGWTDAHALHKFAGQSLRMTEKQIRECVRQRKQDGAI